MPTLLLQFPARRYHATPWSNHVNEGVIEWPPSPWRLLRALVSVGYTTQHWVAIPEVGVRLIEHLASVLPRYRIPTAIATHSRHYMPIGGLREDKVEKTTLVFDTWARIEEGTLAIHYEVELPSEERELLDTLVTNLNYLGRSESWVVGEVVDAWDESGSEVVACAETPRPGPGWEQVNLMSPETAEAYSAWRVDFEARSSTSPTKSRSNKSSKQRGPAIPADLTECVLAETSSLRRAGWSQPPGTRQVLYWRPSDALEATGPRMSTNRRSAPHVEVMLFALTPESNNLHALPSLTRALPQAERLHRRLVSVEQAHSEVLTGQSEDKQPLQGHSHNHILPLNLDNMNKGRIDHILLWAPMGFDAHAQEVARAIRQTYAKKAGKVKLALVGMREETKQLMQAHGEWSTVLARVIGPTAGTGRKWISATPFVPPRYLKPRGRHTLEGQVRAELESRGLDASPEAVRVEFIDARDPAVASFRHYAIHRKDRSPPPQSLGVGLRLEFAEPVPGPVTLGYGSHFGLGRFECVDEP